MSDDTPTQPPATTTLAHREKLDKAEEIRTQLTLARNRTRHALTDLRVELQSELSAKTDWKNWYRAQPEVFLGVAFLLGFLYGHRRD